jgi:23S rRNA (uracil1939-C5)-methyltransferase
MIAEAKGLFLQAVSRSKNIVLQNVLVEDYAAEGKSLAKVDGKVIFIEGAVPGDIVDVRLTKNKKDWGDGQPVYFHSYSKERVEPFCQHFGICGGCQWQMLPYGKQLVYKEKQVYDHLTRIGKIDLPPFSPIIGAKEDKFYRNKLEYSFSTKEFYPAPPTPQRGDSANAQLSLSRETSYAGNYHNFETDLQQTASIVHRGALGFHPRGFFDKIVDIKKCWLQIDLTNAIRNAIRRYAFEENISFYDIRAHSGILRTMQVRICTTGEVMVNIVFGDNEEKKRAKLLKYVKDLFPQITTLLFTINLKRNDSMQDLEPQVYSGKGFVIEQLAEFRFKIGPKSFFQTNTKQAERLYEVTRGFAELDGNQTLYDLYCGTGSIGIFCSKGAKKIIGVEMIEAAILDARENASLNNIDHSSFVQGDVIEICNDDFFSTHGKPDVLITDPPRAGMHAKLVEKIMELAAPVLVYVSCNPATQARDLSLLDAKYSVTKVQPVDMFPHTHHIENIVQAKLK